MKLNFRIADYEVGKIKSYIPGLLNNWSRNSLNDFNIEQIEDHMSLKKGKNYAACSFSRYVSIKCSAPTPVREMLLFPKLIQKLFNPGFWSVMTGSTPPI